jgi:hypothetical protein
VEGVGVCVGAGMVVVVVEGVGVCGGAGVGCVGGCGGRLRRALFCVVVGRFALSCVVEGWWW